MTPQVGSVAFQPAPQHGDKRHGVHNRIVLDLSLQQVLLRGCSLHSTSMFNWCEKKERTQLQIQVHERYVDSSNLVF